MLGQSCQGLQPSNVHLLDTLPEPLQLGFLRGRQPFGLMFVSQLIEPSLFGLRQAGVLLDAGQQRGFRFFSSPVLFLPSGELLLKLVPLSR